MDVVELSGLHPRWEGACVDLATDRNHCGACGNECFAGQFCEAGVCHACKNECMLGAKSCTQNQKQILECADLDDDTCFEWWPAKECGSNEHCEGGACLPSCQDTCGPAGARICDSGGVNGYRLCSDQGDGCLGWGPPVACKPNEACLGGNCEACTDDCSLGQQKCAAPPQNGFLTCGAFDADPCLDWGGFTACPATEGCTGDGFCVNQDPLVTPLRGAFYYPWFPEHWIVDGVHVFYQVTLGYYDSGKAAIVDRHIQELDYAKIDVAIAMWSGVSVDSEEVRIPLLLNRTAALHSRLKWTFYYAKEATSNPTVQEIGADLDYLQGKYGRYLTMARIGSKPIIFVYSADDTTCEVADRWSQASKGGWYVVLKVFSGYASCSNQPDGWHQYAPANASVRRTGYSTIISPGYWKPSEATPRLVRDVNLWYQNVRDMVASGEPWQLITTYNGWDEGTAVELAQEWNSASGFGVYLDALHTDGN